MEFSIVNINNLLEKQVVLGDLSNVSCSCSFCKGPMRKDVLHYKFFTKDGKEYLFQLSEKEGKAILIEKP